MDVPTLDVVSGSASLCRCRSCLASMCRFGLRVARSWLLCEMDVDGHGIVRTRPTTRAERDNGHHLAGSRRDAEPRRLPNARASAADPRQSVTVTFITFDRVSLPLCALY